MAHLCRNLARHARSTTGIVAGVGRIEIFRTTAGSSVRRALLSHTPSSVRYFSASSTCAKNYEGSYQSLRPSTSSKKGGSAGYSSGDRRDHFDRPNGSDSGKFGRPSFGQRDTKVKPTNRTDSSYGSAPSASPTLDYPQRSTTGQDGGRMRKRDIIKRLILSPESKHPGEHNPELSQTSQSAANRINPKFDYLYSPNVVLSALKNQHRKCHRVFYSNLLIQNRKKRKADPVRDCIEVASGMGVNIIRVTKHELNELSDQRPHQGIVLETSKLSQRFVTSLGPVSTTNQYSAHGPDAKYNFRRREDEPPVWIALDEVVDPQNLGAIMRSAFFLGVDGVIVCHKNSAPLSAVVSKASAGALEMRSTYGVTSLARFLQESKKNGWHVVGAHASQTSMRNRPLHLWPETGVDQPTLLVMGSEGNGLRKHVMEQCDTFIQIPTINSIASNVDSLNVSVATGIILSKLMGGRFLHLPKNLKKYPDRYHQAELAAAKLVWASKKDEEFKEDEYADKEDHDDDNDHSDDADDEQEQNVVTKFKSTNKNASKNDNLPF